MKLIDALCAVFIAFLCIPPLLHFQNSLQIKHIELMNRKKHITYLLEEMKINAAKNCLKGKYENYFTE